MELVNPSLIDILLGNGGDFDKVYLIIAIARLLMAVFMAILFLQSGIDKIVDWKGNLGWLKGHFSSSPLKHVVPLLLIVITVLEVATGVCALGGIFEMLLFGRFTFILLSFFLSAIAIICLFFGQRMAKDYAGAGGLVPYFILALLGILSFAI